MTQKKVRKKCLYCNTDFDVYKNIESSRKFCSKKCYTNFQNTEHNIQRKRKKVVCLHCKNEFEVRNYSHQKYCSIKCSSHHQEKKNNKIEKECLNCKKKYYVFKYREKNSKFCSTKCFNQYRQQTIQCPTCKMEFTSPKYENRKYCSEDCSNKGVDKRKTKFSNEIKSFISKYRKIKEEYPIKSKLFKYSVDIKVGKKIIECYGDYWHCNPIKYEKTYYHSKLRKTAAEIWEYDLKRKNNIELLKYKIISIWENDWYNDKENTINKILNFLKNEI